MGFRIGLGRHRNGDACDALVGSGCTFSHPLTVNLTNKDKNMKKINDCCCDIDVERMVFVPVNLELYRSCADAVRADEMRPPTQVEQRDAADQQRYREQWLGLQYKTGPRRGQQLAEARKGI